MSLKEVRNVKYGHLIFVRKCEIPNRVLCVRRRLGRAFCDSISHFSRKNEVTKNVTKFHKNLTK